MNFWSTVPKPFLIQAPMEDVTDTVFRQMLLTFGKPDVFFTEFTSVDGLLSRGTDIVGQRLQFSPKEHPIVAQVWGNVPENFTKAAKKIAGMGFDGIDINMGCPQKNVMAHGCGGKLIENHELVEEIVSATKKGAPSLPLSIKTRIGIKTIATREWISFLLTLPVDALIIHARTVQELSKVPAHWDEIGKAVKIRNQQKSKTLIIGNGDVASYTEAMEKIKQYGVDGVMIGRGMFTNPWIFNPKINLSNISLLERLHLLQEHILLYKKIWGGKKSFLPLRKLYKMYIHDVEGAKRIRTELITKQTLEDTLRYLSSLIS